MDTVNSITFFNKDNMENRYIGKVDKDFLELYCCPIATTEQMSVKDFEKELDKYMFLAPFETFPVSICTWVWKDSTIFPTISNGDFRNTLTPLNKLAKHICSMADGLPVSAIEVTLYDEKPRIWLFTVRP